MTCSSLASGTDVLPVAILSNRSVALLKGSNLAVFFYIINGVL